MDRFAYLHVSMINIYLLLILIRDKYHTHIPYFLLASQIYNISKIHNCFTINLDNYFGEVGFINIFESRNWYLLKSRLSILGIKLLVNLIENTLFNFEIIKRKILVLDCDNTLWGGVIGEDGISNIILGTDGMGQIYKDIQKIFVFAICQSYKKIHNQYIYIAQQLQ